MTAIGSMRRVILEVEKLKAMANASESSGEKFLLEQSPIDNPSSNLIVGRIFPNSNIYNKGSFRIELALPPEYPFKPPDVRFITPMHHINVDSMGKICLRILSSADGYRPITSLSDIVKEIIKLIDNPDIDRAFVPGNQRNPKSYENFLFFQNL